MAYSVSLYIFCGLRTAISSKAIEGILVLFIVYVVYRALYNTFLHPLRCFDGPVWATISPFYLTYLFATKKSHLRTKELHEKYGSVVRLGPNLLSFSNPKALPTVYHRTAEKTTFYSTGLAGETAPLLQIQGHDAHAAKLKVLMPTYSMKNIKLLEPEIDQRVSMSIEFLRTRHVMTEQPADLAEWVRWYVYDTITHAIYGEPAGFVETGADVEGLIESWHDMFFLGGLVATLPWLIHPLITSWPLKRWLMPSKAMHRGSGHIMQSHERLFRSRLEHPHLARPGNIFDSFCDAHDELGRPFTLADAERECFLLTVAGQDTTAAFISPLVAYVATIPPVRQRLLAEIREFETAGRLSYPVARFEQIAAMPYLQACVRETLRLRPPTPIILPRHAAPGGFMLDGRFVPEGTEIGANPWIIHRDEDVFGSDANQFRPERWLENQEHTARMMRYDFTWGYGSRRCIGKNIALMDGTKFALQLFREFDVQPINSERPWVSENWGINIYFKQFVRLQPRKA